MSKRFMKRYMRAVAKKLAIYVMIFILSLGGLATFKSFTRTRQESPSVSKALNIDEYNGIVRNIETKQDVEKIEVAKDVDLQEKIIELNKFHNNEFITAITELGEIVLNEYTGVYNISHEKNKDYGWWDVNNSNITLNGTYKALSTIKLDSSNLNINEMGVLNVDIDIDDILIRGIEMKGTQGEMIKPFIGKSYSMTEIEALKNVEVERIRSSLYDDENLRLNDMTVLIKTITDIANSIGVETISFNKNQPIKMDAALNFSKPPTPLEAKDNKALGIQKIDYIVVHSTANSSASARGHYDWYNSDTSANTVHFVVDDKEVIQCLPFTLQGHGVAINKFWDEGQQKIFNSNSISLEICENGDNDAAIARAQKFIREVLVPQFPNAKIVSHQEANGKFCPAIILNETNGWANFLSEIYR